MKWKLLAYLVAFGIAAWGIGAADNRNVITPCSQTP